MKFKFKDEKIDVPSSLGFEEEENTLIITMPKEAIVDNMQANRAAFEAWALLAKAKGYSKIKLQLKTKIKFEDINEKGHFNRFLYRVKCFEELFDWLEISDDNLREEVNKFKDKYLNGKVILVYNIPEEKGAGNKGLKDDGTATESYMECFLADVNNIDETNKKLGIKAKKYYQQLPVGLFENQKSNKTRIFTGGKSAIDFWGITENTLNIIELKVGKNKSLGVLSEIFFYTCLMRDCHINKFAEACPGKDCRGFDEIRNSKIDKVKAFILVEKKHPQIDKAYEELKMVSQKNEKICFADTIKEYDSKDYIY